MPAPGRHEAGHATPYQQHVYPPQHTSGAQTVTTKASAIPSTSQGCDETVRGAKTPEVDPHPEGLKDKTGETDPPPEDLGNVTEVSPVTILWTMSPNMWPRAEKEASPT